MVTKKEMLTKVGEEHKARINKVNNLFEKEHPTAYAEIVKKFTDGDWAWIGAIEGVDPELVAAKNLEGIFKAVGAWDKTNNQPLVWGKVFGEVKLTSAKEAKDFIEKGTVETKDELVPHMTKAKGDKPAKSKAWTATLIKNNLIKDYENKMHASWGAYMKSLSDDDLKKMYDAL